jgi:hypothetical protein
VGDEAAEGDLVVGRREAAGEHPRGDVALDRLHPGQPQCHRPDLPLAYAVGHQPGHVGVGLEAGPDLVRYRITAAGEPDVEGVAEAGPLGHQPAQAGAEHRGVVELGRSIHHADQDLLDAAGGRSLGGEGVEAGQSA